MTIQSEKVLCQVGGWEILAVPGQIFTFGCGAALWGPIPMDEVPPEFSWDTEGMAEAIPLHPAERLCQCGGGEPWSTCPMGSSYCG
jgi:hypothetical protein